MALIDGFHRLLIDGFHQRYYNSRVWCGATTWLGIPVAKTPMDLWLYQEILSANCPDLIIETGSAFGGSALFLAGICDLLIRGRIISIDIEPRARPMHPRIEYLTGSSVDPAIVEMVKSKAAGKTVMVSLDSDHRKAHVLAELAAYAPMVTPGHFLVVEDTNVNGHPVVPDFGPGPAEALAEFRETELGQKFEPDPACEKFLLTFNPGGYLRRRP